MSPKVVDAARVTTPSNTVWRTCTGCDRPQPLRAGVERCDTCTTAQPRTSAETGWDIANGFAELVGAIDAWAEKIPGLSDAERLDKIRHLLQTRNPLHRDREVQ